MVDKAGSFIRRSAGDYTHFNAATEGHFYPAHYMQEVLTRATGRSKHSKCDCVRGLSTIPTDDEPSLLLSVISNVGIHKVPCFTFGPKQGPPIHQHMQEDAIGSEFRDTGEKLCDASPDDTNLGDDCDKDYFQSPIQLFTAPRKNVSNIES